MLEGRLQPASSTDPSNCPSQSTGSSRLASRWLQYYTTPFILHLLADAAELLAGTTMTVARVQVF
jgi:hypothetical protein